MLSKNVRKSSIAYLTFFVVRGTSMYYVITKGGGGGSENGNFWLRSVLKVITKGGGGGVKNPKSWLRNTWMFPKAGTVHYCSFPSVRNTKLPDEPGKSITLIPKLHNRYPGICGYTRIGPNHVFAGTLRMVLYHCYGQENENNSLQNPRISKIYQQSAKIRLSQIVLDPI